MEQKERLDTCSNAKSFTLRKSQEAQSILQDHPVLGGLEKNNILNQMAVGSESEENYSSLRSTYNRET